MRSVAIALILALTLGGGQASAWAGARDFVVGVEDIEYYPIYAWRDGEYVGAAREILDAFAVDHGYHLTYRPLPVKRLFAELAAGTIDFKFPDNPHWAVDAKKTLSVNYSEPVLSFIDGVMVRPSNLGRPVDTVRTLGTVSGFTPFGWQDRINAGKAVLKENPKMELLLKQTVVGHVDGAYVSIAVATHTLRSNLALPNALVFDPGLPHTKDFYRLSTTRHPGIVTQFNDWMAHNAGRLSTIKDTLGAERGVK